MDELRVFQVINRPYGSTHQDVYEVVANDVSDVWVWSNKYLQGNVEVIALTNRTAYVARG